MLHADLLHILFLKRANIECKCSLNRVSLSLLFLLFLPLSSFGFQQNLSIKADSSQSKTLFFDDFIAEVRNSNPMIEQFAAMNKQADARIVSAAGAFDPKLYSKFSKKEFDSKTYYQKWETGIEYKTPSPFTFNAGFQENDGQFLNPENSTGKNRLWNLGVSMDLGRGLLTDESRTRYDVSRADRDRINAEVNEQLNEFYVESAVLFWKWSEAYTILNLYKELYELALFRKSGVLRGFNNGDRSAADTLEAHVLVRKRTLEVKESALKYNSALLKVQAYIGKEIPVDIHPESLSIDNLTPLNEDELVLSELIEKHPVRQQYVNKIKAGKSELKLKWEQVRPELALYYNYLSDNSNLQFDVGEQAMFGVKFSLPLFLRKGRGGIQEYKAKVSEYEAALDWAERKLEAMLNQEILAVNTSLELFLTNRLYADELKNLLEYERRRFDIGESSLFVVNQREVSFAMAEVSKIKAFVNYKMQWERWKAVNGTAYLFFLNAK
jgi:outer membrane protein TolC